MGDTQATNPGTCLAASQKFASYFPSKTLTGYPLQADSGASPSVLAVLELTRAPTDEKPVLRALLKALQLRLLSTTVSNAFVDGDHVGVCLAVHLAAAAFTDPRESRYQALDPQNAGSPAQPQSLAAAKCLSVLLPYLEANAKTAEEGFQFGEVLDADGDADEGAELRDCRDEIFEEVLPNEWTHEAESPQGLKCDLFR